MRPQTPIIYLDNNATTPIHPQVLDLVTDCLQHHFGNPASTTHALGWYADELVTMARERIAKAINCSPAEICFTSGATESNNLAIKGILRSKLIQGTPVHAITAATEHPAVIETFRFLEKLGLSLTILPVDRQGHICLDRLRGALRPETAMISLMAANNEIGTIHPITEIGALARSHGVLFHCDATQALGKIPIDVESSSIDLLSLSAHKAYGPKGIGALFVRKDRRSQLEPLMHGGGHELGLRAGTLNVPAIAGFGLAVELVTSHLTEEARAIARHTNQLWQGLQNQLGELPLNGPVSLGVETAGTIESVRLPGNLNFRIPSIKSFSLVRDLASKLAFSTSSACSSDSPHGSRVLGAIGLTAEEAASAVRMGVGMLNTTEEIDLAIDLLSHAVRKLRS